MSRIDKLVLVYMSVEMQATVETWWPRWFGIIENVKIFKISVCGDAFLLVANASYVGGRICNG